MKLGRRPSNYLFILLPLLLLTSISYASMGSITTCFPFFLLLAFLIAAMLAQGKSPLVGFDISVRKPPSEIKSTSYKVKSYTSGGFDTVSKTRDIEGGGTHATRGTGWVANKVAKGLGKVAGKDWGKEGGFTHNLSQRGGLYAITGGKAGGGYAGNAERERKAKEQYTSELKGEKKTAKEQTNKSVKSLRQMLTTGKGLAVAYSASDPNKKRIEELEKKRKSGIRLSNSERQELSDLTTKVAAGTISGMRQEVERLSERERSGKLKPAEAKKLRSLRTELTALDQRYQQLTTNQKRYSLLSERAAEQVKLAAAAKVHEKSLKGEVAALDGVGSAAARAKMAASPFIFAVAGTGLAAKAAYRSLSKANKKERDKLKQELGADADKPLTRKEMNKLDKINKKLKNGEKLNADERILTNKARYQNLRDGKGTISSIFNPMGLSKGQYAKRLVKANIRGVGFAIWETPIPRLGRWIYGKSEARTEGGHLKSLKDASKILNNMDKLDKLRRDIVNSQYISVSEKYRKLGELDRMFADLDRLVRREVPGKKGLPIELKHEIAKGESKMRKSLEHMKESQEELNKLYNQRTNTREKRREIRANKGDTADANRKIKDLNDKIIARNEDLKKNTGKIREIVEKAGLMRKEVQDTKMGLKSAMYSRTFMRELQRRTSNFYDGAPKQKADAERAAARNYAMMKDFYDSAKSSSIFGKLLKLSFDPFANTQKLRQIEDDMENVSNPKLSEIQRLRRERQFTKKHLDDEMEAQAKRAKLLKISPEELEARRKRLQEQLGNLEKEIITLKKNNAPQQQIKEKEAQLKATTLELGRKFGYDLLIEDRKKNLKRIDDNINALLNSFLYSDVLMLQRNLDKRINEDNSVEARKLRKLIDEDEAKLVSLERRMKGMVPTSKEYPKREAERQKLVDSIAKMEEMRVKLVAGRDKETEKLRAQLREASGQTKRLVEKEEASRANWFRKTMEVMGDPRPGSETGLHREHYELSKLLEMSTDAKMLKKEKEKGFTPEMVDYIKKRLSFVNSQLYMKEREISGTQMISFEEAKKYDKMFDDANAKNNVLNASLEAKMRELIVKFDKRELENDRRLGWNAEVEKLKGIIEEHKNKLKDVSKNMGIPNAFSEMQFQINETRRGWNEKIGEVNEKILKTNEEILKASGRGDKAQVSILNDSLQLLEEQKQRHIIDADAEISRVGEKLKQDFQKKTGLDFEDYKREREDFSNKEEECTETALKHRWAMLMMRKDYIENLIAPAEELAEHRGKKPGEFDKEMYRKNLIDRLIADDTKAELQVLEDKYGSKQLEREARALADKGEYITGASRVFTESQKILKVYEEEMKENKKNLREVLKEMPEIKKEIKHLNEEKSELAKDPTKASEYKEIEDTLNTLNNKLPEAQRKFNDSYNEWRDRNKEFDLIFEPEKYRELRRPGSERVEEKHFMDFRHDLENRIYGGRFSRFSGVASKLATAEESAFKHGGKVLGAAAVLAPLAIPFVGPVAFLVSGGAATGYIAKTILRKREEWIDHGYADSGGLGIIARDAYHAGRLASHFTGRGSGRLPTTWTAAWASQTTVSEYITRGFRVNRYGEVKPDKEKLSIPDEGLPWFIKIAKAPIDSIGSTIAARVRKLTLQTEYHTESDKLALYILENPSVIPEAEKRITYQYAQMFGSVEPLLHPKAAWEMMEYNIATPFPEYSKNIIVVKKYSPGTALLRAQVEAYKFQRAQNQRGARGLGPKEMIDNAFNKSMYRWNETRELRRERF
ncbi:hypothetical protein H0N98_00720 [Candidatus Micrarchaeota archaeon]|nr:hypothetical protein [Candidatus Micrarchaeota archaeon]